MKLFSTELLQSLTGNAATLASRLQSKDAIVGVVGLGYVGLPIALEFAKKGFRCVGMDVSKRKIEMLNKGENFIEDLDDNEIRDAVAKGLLKGTNDYADLRDADIIYIAVPTPFNANKDPDLAFIISAGEGISTIIREGQLIILKSTTFPGTTENYLIPVMDKNDRNLTAGKDYFVAFSPERVDPGNKQFHTANTPIVVGGIDENSSILAAQTNSQIIEKVYLVSNPKVAELEKLLENIFRSVNIALVNELALLCERMGGIDVWEVIEAASTKPFGYLKFTPGPGVGGHCIPIDPYYLSWLAREYDFETKFITLAANVNEGMPYHVANLVIREIANQPISLRDAKVLIFGASFKKNVKDLRHSPAEAVIIRLMENGIHNIDVCDPWAPEYPAAGRVFHTIEATAENLVRYDCAILITDHDAYDVDFIVKHSKHVVDTRNMTAQFGELANVTRIGYEAPKSKIKMEH